MKKLVALFLALALCLSLCSMTAFADGYKVSEILSMCKGGSFPTASDDNIPTNAWVNENGNAWLYVYYGYIYFYGNGGVNDGIDPNTQVTQIDQGKYEAFVERTGYTDTVTFNMENGELVSVNFDTNSLSRASLNGTYAPVTIADILPTDFPEVEGEYDWYKEPYDIADGAWVNNNDKNCFIITQNGNKYLNFYSKSDNNNISVLMSQTVASQSTDVYEYNDINLATDEIDFTITFYTEDGVLTYFEFNAIDDKYSCINGDYYPPTGDDDGHDWDYETLAKGAAIAAGITVVAVGTIHTVKAIKNYKAEKAAAAEEAKLAEMPMVAFGDSGDAVTTLQTELNAQGYDCGEVDGIFGQNTLNAVMAFQTANGLDADGVVGAQTWGALL